jgi:hypothetical protein
MPLSSRFAVLGAVLAVVCSSLLNASAQDVPRYEVGAEFMYLRLHPYTITYNRFGFGTRFTLNLNKSFAIDSEWSYTPAARPVISGFDGGRTTQAFVGLKAGKRMDKVGIFFKLRPGFITNSNVFKSQNLAVSDPSRGGQPLEIFGRRFDPLLDTGAVFEIYPSKHWVLRYDVSDTLIFYRHGLQTFGFLPAPVTVTQEPGYRSANLHLSAGISYRFGK